MSKLTCNTKHYVTPDYVIGFIRTYLANEVHSEEPIVQRYHVNLDDVSMLLRLLELVDAHRYTSHGEDLYDVYMDKHTNNGDTVVISTLTGLVTIMLNA
jgi:hypothetical protein